MRVLRCPWHGWDFDLGTGRALFGVSNRRVPTRGVSVERGRVYVDLP